MADRKLIVTIVGDDKSLQAALTRSGAAVNKFGQTANASLSRGGGFSRGLDDLLAKTRENIREAEKLAEAEKRVGDAAGQAAQRLQRAAVLGAGFFALGRTLSGAGAALQVFSGHATETSNALTDAGNAFQSLVTLNLEGFFNAVGASAERTRKALQEYATNIKDANNVTGSFRAEAFAASAGMDAEAKAIRDAREAVEAYAAATAAAEFAQRKWNVAVVDGTNAVVAFKGAVDDREGLRGPGLAETIEIPDLRQFHDPQRPLGPTARNANAQIIAAANDDLQEVLRLQVIARDRTEKAIENSRGNVKQRQALADQLTRERAAVIQTQKQIEENAAAAARAAEAAQEAARREAEAARKEAEARRKALAARAAAAEQARQFRLIGLDPSGGEVVPTISNLRQQLAQLTDNADFNDVPAKLRNRLAGVEKALTDPLRKASVETRKAIKDLFDTIRDTFDDESKGPLTKTTSLNAGKILDGLGLGRDLEKELRARLSSFNSAGLALAGTRSPTGGFVSSAPIVVENHTTVELDGTTVGKSVTRTQQKNRRRNPKQKRGPNSGI